MNKEEKYNQLLKDKLEDANFEYNTADWNSLASQLPKSGIKPFHKLLIAASVVVISISTVYYFNKTTTNQVQIENKNLVESNTSTPTPIDVKNSTNPPISNDTIAESNEISDNTTIDKKSIKKEEKTIAANTSETVAIEKDKTNQTEFIPIDKSGEPKIISTNQLVLNSTKFCIGEKLFIELKETNNDNYKILINNKNLIAQDNSYYLDKAGDFKIELFQNNELVDTKTILVYEASKAIIKYNKVSEEFGKISYQFSTSLNSNESVVWKVNGAQAFDQANFTYDFKRAMNAQVEAIVTNNNGCANNEMRVISIQEDFDILSYDAFTPNGDGINDEFIPKAIEANNLRFEMQIKSLSGNLIYSTTDYSKPWNGRMNNDNEMMPVGTYIWIVNLYDDEGIVHPYNGQIKIIKLTQ